MFCPEDIKSIPASTKILANKSVIAPAVYTSLIVISISVTELQLIPIRHITVQHGTAYFVF